LRPKQGWWPNNLRHHTNLMGSFLAVADFFDRLLTIFSRPGVWSASIEAPRSYATPPESTARASLSSTRSARISLSLTPSRRIRSCTATSPNNSSRDGSVQPLLHMTSSRHNSTAGELGLNRQNRSKLRARTRRPVIQHAPWYVDAPVTVPR
jgi:hypothetical protein